VRATHDPIRTERLHVHLHVRQALARVEKHLGADASSEIDNFLHWCHTTGDITHVRRRDEPRLFVHQRAKLIHVQFLRILRQFNEFQHAPRPLSEQLPRDDI
jgi:hypothetical protein